jgi:hypothetical protein
MAERLAREAVELFAKTDDLFQQSQVLMALAGSCGGLGSLDFWRLMVDVLS